MKKWEGNILPEHHIEEQFTCDGVPYYAFTDAFNIPCERAMDALHIYQEFKNRTDDEFLKSWLQAKQNLYLKNPINVFELKKLDDQLGERLMMALPPARIVEQLCAVYYFDESENPYRFDRAYAETKISKWKTGKIEVDGEEKSYDFFLLNPIRSLIPSFDLSEEDSANYLKIAGMMDAMHMETISSHLSSKQRNNPLFKQHSSISTTARTNA